MENINKPKCKLIGKNGNIYNLLALAQKALRENGFVEQSTEMRNKIFSCGSYDEALNVIQEYVDVE